MYYIVMEGLLREKSKDGTGSTRYVNSQLLLVIKGEWSFMIRGIGK